MVQYDVPSQDDNMAVFHTHAVVGTLGAILTVALVDPKLNRLFYNGEAKYVGFVYGIQSGRFNVGLRQLGVQLIGIAFIVAWNVISTSLICLVIKMVVPLRMTEEEVSLGDNAVHGEEAYALWGDGEKFDNCSSYFMKLKNLPCQKVAMGFDRITHDVAVLTAC